jgi:hypothetical protein
MQLPPGKPQFVRRAIRQLGNLPVHIGDIGIARSVDPGACSTGKRATARQSVGEPTDRELAVSCAWRFGNAVDATAFLFG